MIRFGRIELDSETLELSNFGISNRTESNRIRSKQIEISKKFALREPMFNSVRFGSVTEKSSRVSL
jgi:hypothetical protein